tara:strand:+ start:408 stop:698 length:291 start_codon:yes stop_codon:yes gene_type:complete
MTLREGSHGSILNGNYAATQVTSAWKSTPVSLKNGHHSGLLQELHMKIPTILANYSDIGNKRGCTIHYSAISNMGVQLFVAIIHLLPRMAYSWRLI